MDGWHQAADEAGQQAQKKPRQLAVQVQDDEADMDHAFAGVRELRHDPRQRALAFGVAEFPFHWNTRDLVGVDLPLERGELLGIPRQSSGARA